MKRAYLCAVKRWLERAINVTVRNHRCKVDTNLLESPLVAALSAKRWKTAEVPLEKVLLPCAVGHMGPIPPLETSRSLPSAPLLEHGSPFEFVEDDATMAEPEWPETPVMVCTRWRLITVDNEQWPSIRRRQLSVINAKHDHTSPLTAERLLLWVGIQSEQPILQLDTSNVLDSFAAYTASRLVLCPKDAYKFDPSRDIYPFDESNQLNKLLMAAYGDAFYEKRKASVVIVLKPAADIPTVVLLGEMIPPNPNSPQRYSTCVCYNESVGSWFPVRPCPLSTKGPTLSEELGGGRLLHFRTKNREMWFELLYKKNLELAFVIEAILVLFCTKNANGEFGAYVPEFVHIPAQLNVAVHDELLRHGLHAEIVGEVADRKEACGIVLLDYTAYVDVDLFEAAIKPMEDYLLKSNGKSVLNETIRMEVFKTMKAKALAAHKAELRDLFDKRRASTPLYRATELQFFPYAGVVALGIGMGLGSLIFKGVEHYFRDTGTEHRQYKSKIDTQIKLYGNMLMDVINGMTFETSNVQFGSAFALVRYQVYAQVRDTLDQLFGFGRVAEDLLESSSNCSLMSAIKRLEGERFSQSLMALHGSGARDALKATVIGMNSATTEIKICYPTTMASDVDYLVHVEPLGQFLPSIKSYWMHDVGGLYAIGKTENQNISLAKLRMVEHGSSCSHSSSVMLCNLQEQMAGCGLLSASRQNCRLVMHNSTDEHFTLVRPLARSVIIATRATRMLEMPQEIGKIRPPKIITKPVFAVEVPRGKWLMVGDEAVHSRIVQGEMGTDLKVIVPQPGLRTPPVALDFWMWPKFDVSTLLPLLISLLAVAAMYRSMYVLKQDMTKWKDYYLTHGIPKYPVVPGICDQ